MIYYFSGTGNSKYIAQQLGKNLGLDVVDIPSLMQEGKAQVPSGEPIGFVYPVYAWGPPKMVTDFADQLRIDVDDAYLFSVCTCGDDEGNTTKMLDRVLMRNGQSLDSAFAVRMPNNYIIGYTVDDAATVQEKFDEAERMIAHITESVKERQSGVFENLIGSAPAIKSALIHHLFVRFACNTKKFRVTKACVECGLCERVCPVQSIKADPVPVWGEACTQCLACLNRCPVSAIEFGKSTVGKERYVHPILQKKSE